MMERYDLYDRDRTPLGRTAARGEMPPPGAYGVVLHVALFHPDGRLLLQRRQPWKSTWPGLWDLSVGGGVQAGESSRQAAEREVREELGLTVDLSRCRPALTVSYPGGFDDIYLLTRAVELSELTLQREEVAEVRWASRPEVHTLLEAGTFIPYHSGFIDLLFDLRQVPGPYRSQAGRRGQSAAPLP